MPRQSSSLLTWAENCNWLVGLIKAQVKVDYSITESLQGEGMGRTLDLAMVLQIRAGRFTKTEGTFKVPYQVCDRLRILTQY